MPLRGFDAGGEVVVRVVVHLCSACAMFSCWMAPVSWCDLDQLTVEAEATLFGLN